MRASLGHVSYQRVGVDEDSHGHSTFVGSSVLEQERGGESCCLGEQSRNCLLWAGKGKM